MLPFVAQLWGGGSLGIFEYLILILGLGDTKAAGICDGLILSFCENLLNLRIYSPLFSLNFDGILHP